MEALGHLATPLSLQKVHCPGALSMQSLSLVLWLLPRGSGTPAAPCCCGFLHAQGPLSSSQLSPGAFLTLVD